MEKQMEWNEDEEQRRERRRQRIAEMKRQKERRQRLQQYIKCYGVYAVGAVITISLICIGVGLLHKNEQTEEYEMPTIEAVEQEVSNSKQTNDNSMQTTVKADTAGEAENKWTDTSGNPEGLPPEEIDIPVGDVTFHAGYTAEVTAETITPDAEDVYSEYAILIDAGTDTIVAQKNAGTIINPASMTKILTLLVAAEHVTDLDDTFTMTLDITDYAYVNDCSSVGFLDEEVVTVRDLLYGTILPSGGDAAVALATYVAGSQEAFVNMMNDKLEELGLSETAHFTNCVGLYHEEHYCTVYDMAMIMKAAAENDLCREVLSTRTYTTSVTAQHPEGITISNWFIRRIEDKDTGGKVICAKTGYVAQSGSCAASYAISDEGTPYLCVTAQTYSSWRCIYDHVALYKKYTPK